MEWYCLYAYIEEEWILIDSFSSFDEAHYNGTQLNPFAWKVEVEVDK